MWTAMRVIVWRVLEDEHWKVELLKSITEESEWPRMTV